MADSNSLVATVQGATVDEQSSTGTLSKMALLNQIGGGVRLTQAQQAALVVDADDSIIDLKPTGEIYVAGAFWRKRLNEVFGPLGWGVRGMTPQMDLHESGGHDQGKSTMYREVFLLVARCSRCQRSMSACECLGPLEAYCVSTTYGAQDYHPSNKRMSFDDAAEGALTNGLMRCCKDGLGLYGNIWEPQFAKAAQRRLGVKVHCRTWDNKVRAVWRRLDGVQVDGEVGVAEDSPNQDAYAERFKTMNHPTDGGGQQQKPVRTQPIVKQSEAAPAATVGPAEALFKGEKILVIRLVQHASGKFWVLNLDPSGELIMDDETMVVALENAKARGHRIVVTSEEAVKTMRGSRRKLLEYRLVGAEKH